jgi:hypothetical protein
MPNFGETARINILTMKHMFQSLSGCSVVALMDQHYTKVLGQNSAHEMSHLVRVQMGGAVVFIYGQERTQAEDGSFPGLNSKDQYCIIIYRKGKQTILGPMFYSGSNNKVDRRKQNKLTGDRIGIDEKSGGDHVFTFTNISARDLLDGSKKVGQDVDNALAERSRRMQLRRAPAPPKKH